MIQGGKVIFIVLCQNGNWNSLSIDALCNDNVHPCKSQQKSRIIPEILIIMQGILVYQDYNLLLLQKLKYLFEFELLGHLIFAPMRLLITTHHYK